MWNIHTSWRISVLGEIHWDWEPVKSWKIGNFFRTVVLLIEEYWHSKKRNLMPLTQKKVGKYTKLLDPN